MKGSERTNVHSRAIVLSLLFTPFHSLSLLLLLLFLPVTSHTQIAGLNTLTLLDISSQARTSGMGFDYLTVYSDDPTLAIDNPSLLRGEMSGIGSLSFVSLFQGSMMGSLSYAHHSEKAGMFIFAFRFNNYGRFDGYDEEEFSTGTFTAADYALTVGWGLWIDSNFTIGATLKPVLSHYESYTAMAVAFDVAGSYFSDNRRFAATVIGRNIGAQVMTFDQTVETLPFELSAEVSYKLSKAPFRLFLGANELQRWDLRYEDPLSPTTETDPFTGEVTKEKWYEGFFDNLLRHMQVGVELNLGKSLFARVGYSYRQSAEMKGLDALNMSGFSFGVGLHTKRFDFAYSRRNYHLSQAPDFFTLSYRF